MRREVIDPAGFEAKYREDIDPWNYAASPFERFKRGVLLAACGPGPFGRALELGCGAGMTSRALAPRCLALLALDASETAIAEAKRHAAARTRYAEALLPRDMPRGPYDLIVASEILYYLRPADLDPMLARMARALAPGGRLVVLHHLLDFDDAPIRPRAAQARARDLLGRRLAPVFLRHAGRFQAIAFERPRRLSTGAARNRTPAPPPVPPRAS